VADSSDAPTAEPRRDAVKAALAGTGRQAADALAPVLGQRAP
jgi:hypothetical protein